MIDHLRLCEEAAKAGVKAILAESSKAMLKADEHVGHHAVVTEADYKSQDAILQIIIKKDKSAFFLTEEGGEKFKEKRITKENLSEMERSGVYIIDELDGTSSFATGHHEWSVSIGYVENLEHKAGAIYAPKIEGGLLFSAATKKGAFLQIGNSKRIKIQIAKREPKNSYILVGVDCVLQKYPIHNRLLIEVGEKARTLNMCGSCALALGLVASGRADALIQPLQSPWDWAAGKIMVEEAGGKMIFYEMPGEEIRRIEKLKLEHYDPSKRAVGFVAGNMDLAKEIFEMLEGCARC